MQRDWREIGRPSRRDADDDRAAVDRERGEVDRGVLGAAIAGRQFALEIEMIALAECTAWSAWLKSASDRSEVGHPFGNDGSRCSTGPD